MGKMNPIERSNYIEENYKEYIRSSFEFGDTELQNLFIEQLDKEKLFKGPYVDMSFPFVRGHNLEYLIEHNVVCKSFKRLENIDFKRPLYSHQEEAIKLIKNGRNAIITTGTGSGKTESFLYPILNELLYDVENGNKDVGVRAIFLYPMNALVNDQIDRIRKILKNCPEITFGFFTGETKETVQSNHRNKIRQDNNIFIPDNELVSREEIRKNPPHFLFTNYSMLEYLLIRPDDYSILSPQKLKNWKYVVLDEAHSYSGSLGIELSLLLRRVTGLAYKKPKFILTSATLGEQGKSEKDIVRFATNLTSAEFDISDIIFSKRKPLQEKPKYRISGSDYVLIKKSIKNFYDINKIALKYYSGDTRYKNTSELVYDLLLYDENVHTLSNLLKNGSKEFVTIYNEFRQYLKKEELIALIDIVNEAEKNGVGLFELKYHSFVRSLSGAYITYGKQTKLSLTKTSEIDGMKAFEVGNCRYCRSLYLIGRIKEEEDQMYYLLQNQEVDIYENYGSEKFVKIDYFLLKDVINEEEFDEDKIEPWQLCAKCGEIHVSKNLNAKKCKCEDQYRKDVYKVIQSDDEKENTIYNNINQCPCCGNRYKSGIVKAFNIGKDESTALIGQILYEAIDEDEKEVKNIKKVTLTPATKIVSPKEQKVKQYLVFSDSRQQASFAASFFNYNHVRMLRKRLIWEIIENHNYEDLSFNELTSYIEEKIKYENLFENNMDSHKNAWATTLVDLLKVDGSYDGEGLGLYYFDLDIQKIIDEFSDEEIARAFEGLNMTKNKLYTLTQVAFTLFKTVPAINYVKSTLTQEEKSDILGYRGSTNYVTLINPEKSNKYDIENKKYKNVKSFLPTKNETNRIVRYTIKAFECSPEQAKKSLDLIFGLLEQASGNSVSDKIILKNGNNANYQINSSHYLVKNYKKSKFYQCDKCNKLTPYNINDKCVQDKCKGKLNEIDPDIVLKSNYYRNKYKTKKIENIVIKEHTAQLDKEHANEYQNEFKNKKINILSCSTTFEMGIDIGRLETVFMRNVPPTPANYVQRAGRAGRRKGSVAYILTYCGTNSHDYTYFSEPEKMISGVINPPYFNVLNKKIITRHLMATSLGFFFRENPKYSKKLDDFIISGDGFNKFNEYMQSRPSDLDEYINKKILPEMNYAEYRDFNWYNEISTSEDKISHFVETIQEMIKEFEEAKEKAIKKQTQGDEQASNNVTYYIKQINNLKKEDVIKYLSKYCVIPKYGFPIDVVDLRIYDNGFPKNNYDMNRDLRLAISEYAPDSEVIVDNEKYISKYITLKKQGEMTKNWFIKCEICKRINIFLSKINDVECRYCGQVISTEKMEYYIEPSNGFKGIEAKKSTVLKPKRSYSGEVSYVGNGEIDEKKLLLGNVMCIETSSYDELLIMNKSKFRMCNICGYSYVVKSKDNYQQLKPHKNFKQFSCTSDNFVNLKLGHKFQTDVARFIIPNLKYLDKLEYKQALSFLYAFLEGISIFLNIERNDIDGILDFNMNFQSFDIVLFDNVPGGAGHVKRLLNREAVLMSLKTGLEKISKECCDENTSCYNCLRNYYNQSYHSKLERKLAIDTLRHIIFEIEKANENFQNKDFRWDSNLKSSAKYMNVVLGTDGRNPGLETSTEIWNDILDDCFYENEIDIIRKLKSNSPEIISRPYYSKTVKIVETGESFVANLIWDDKKVMLFLNDAYDDYKLAKKTGWSVYCTNEVFDIDELLCKVGE